MNQKFLTETHPQLCKEWHSTKNGLLIPENFTYGSNKKIWWQCQNNNEHFWIATIANRSKNRGCPYCSNKKVNLANCLATTHPETTKEWHPIKNGKLTPFDIVSGSGKKVWWKCFDGHEWLEAPVVRKVQNTNCPFCSRHRATPETSLAITHPEIAKEWHPTKNGILIPKDFLAGSGKKVWWKCPVANDHEWLSTIINRVKIKQCPYCSNSQICLSNCLATTHPHLVKEWHPTKNGKLTAFDIISGTNRKVWWKCPVANDHEWKTSVCHRANDRNCPCCSGHKRVESNSIYTTHPEIIKEWHPTKNGILTPKDFSRGSHTEIWWQCTLNKNHIWKSTIHNRIRNKSIIGCIFCSISSGEKEIMKFLEKYNFNYKKEFSFKNCKSKASLRFDFLIHRNQKNVKLIEYQGEQHYKPIKFSGCTDKVAERNFRDCQKRDKIKREWCKRNGIPLIEIPYWEFDNIENIIISLLT